MCLARPGGDDSSLLHHSWAGSWIVGSRRSRRLHSSVHINGSIDSQSLSPFACVSLSVEKSQEGCGAQPPNQWNPFWCFTPILNKKKIAQHPFFQGIRFSWCRALFGAHQDMHIIFVFRHYSKRLFIRAAVDLYPVIKKNCLYTKNYYDQL